MVILVAAALAFTAIKLQPTQDKNVRVEKMQNILSSIGIKSTVKDAEKLFAKYIVQQISVDFKGSEVKDITPFDINLKIENKKETELRRMPVYLAKLDDGSTKTIFPLLGKGLWGPVWGYISFNDDNNTVYGAVFDHKSETPGLGAEINTEWFREPFKGKTIFDKAGKFVSIKVHKGGKGAAIAAGDSEHGVDAISGGTITSNGLEKMLLDCLAFYEAYLNAGKKE